MSETRKRKKNFPLIFASDELEARVREAAAMRGESVTKYINDRLKRTLPKKKIG